MIKKLEEGQLVLCTVTKIVGTSVFVKIEEQDIEGTITFMEIAPGRIRNIREYAFPGKKIICKVLSIRPNYIELSFRRVKVSERNEFNENYKKERSYSAMLKTLLGEAESQNIIKKIKESEQSLVEFLELSKTNTKLLEKYIPKESIEKLISILSEKKVKEKEIGEKFSLSSKASDGILRVKNTIKEASKELKESSEISYIAAGKYLIKIKTKDPRIADQQLRKMLGVMENMAKKNGCIFGSERK